MASRLNPSNFGYQNFYSGILTADITSGSLTISLDTVPTPTSGILVIDPDSATSREVILYTSKGASTITLPSDGRGFSGSTAAAHLTGTTVIMAPIDKFFSAIASGELSTDPLRTESFFDYVASGCVWTADAAGSTKNASMTAGVVYINGRRLTVAAVTAHVFTASKDTYVDFSDNGDGTALVNYNEQSNNGASLALSTNNLRNAIIVTGATNIAAAGSINQGQEDRVLPIASSVAYTTTDSLGNLICPRDPNRKILGYRQILANFSTASTTAAQVTGLTCPVIPPAGRKLKITTKAPMAFQSVAANGTTLSVWEGTPGSGTLLGFSKNDTDAASYQNNIEAIGVRTTAGGLTTYNTGFQTGAGTGTLGAVFTTLTAPIFILVELV